MYDVRMPLLIVILFSAARTGADPGSVGRLIP